MPGLCDLISATAWEALIQEKWLPQSQQGRHHSHEESYCTEGAKQQQNSGEGGIQAHWHLQVETTAPLAQIQRMMCFCLSEQNSGLTGEYKGTVGACRAACTNM